MRSPSTSAPASGVQLGSGCPCHHNLGRPAPPPNTPDDGDDSTLLPPRSQRISSSPPSTPFGDTSAGLPKTAPMALPPPPPTPAPAPALLLLGGRGGRWTRRNGRGDACAARRQLRVKADSETRSAMGGGSFAAVFVVGFGPSFGPMTWGTRGDSDSEGWGMPVAEAGAYLNTTPSSSRRYAGPIFLFSALHCARTRNLRRFSMVQPIGSAVASRGSG